MTGMKGGTRMAGINRRVLVALGGGFVLLGLLRVLLYGVPFFSCFAQFFCAVVVLVWAASVHKRITNRRLRRLLLSAAALLLFYLALQVCRYGIFHDRTVLCRYCWYLFYLPLTTFPVLLLAVALVIHQPEGWRLPLWFWVLAGGAGLMVLGVLTNDLHMWFKYFPGPVWTDDGTEQSRWLFYAVSTFSYPVYFLDYGIILYKCRVTTGRLRLLPLAPLITAVVYFLIYPIKLDLNLLGFRILNIGEVLVFCLIGGVEICIQTGMIPANTDYERLFALAKVPAVILDDQETLHYATAGADYPFPDREGLQVMTHPIHGGRIVWTADVEGLTGLNRELTDAAQQLEARNAYLTDQTQLRAEKTELETRGRIYDDVGRATRAQSERIAALLEAEEPAFETRLRQIAVLSAFIKRRGNMVLIEENGRLPFEELGLAVAESLSCLRLCGVSAASFSTGAGDFPAPVITDAYEALESAFEACLDGLLELLIYLDAQETALRMRVLIRAEDPDLRPFGAPPDLPGWSRQISVTGTGEDRILVYLYAKGGEAP